MYSDGDLMDMREKFLKEERPEEYERLVQEDELEAHLEERAVACVERAENYMRQGVIESQSWRWAIRVALLERDPD
ncbi:MAG: hypothetical protein J4F40_18620 [Alphaproteobacteria bacterium]|nr:hypothetical protein [Alphaproteobacteria bacterium]